MTKEQNTCCINKGRKAEAEKLITNLLSYPTAGTGKVMVILPREELYRMDCRDRTES